MDFACWLVGIPPGHAQTGGMECLGSERSPGSRVSWIGPGPGSGLVLDWHIDSELPKVLFKVPFFTLFWDTFLEHFLKHFIENFLGGNELFWALFYVLLKVLELFGALF